VSARRLYLLFYSIAALATFHTLPLLATIDMPLWMIFARITNQSLETKAVGVVFKDITIRRKLKQ